MLDPHLVDETREWFAKAALDIRAAHHDLGASPPLLADAAFHSQQAVEKALKGFLVWHNQPFRRTHSLEEIGEQCLDIDPGLRSLIDRAVPLTEYAWRFRYPGEPEEPSQEEAEDAIELAEEIFEATMVRLPPEVRV